MTGPSTLSSRGPVWEPSSASLSVSPDATRIVYAAGKNCSQLKVISSRGGTALDVTPTARPGTSTFEYDTLGWTSDGHYVTFADCRATDGPVRCGGQSLGQSDAIGAAQLPRASCAGPGLGDLPRADHGGVSHRPAISRALTLRPRHRRP